jgi:2'-5' RNA ligase
MGYAASLYFDSAATQTLLDYFQRVGSRCTTMGIPPHISLASFDSAEVPVLEGVVREFAAQQERFFVDMPAVASFLSGERVIFLAPVVTRHLLELHSAFYEGLARRGISFNPLYQPGNWVPHCTLDMGLAAEEYAGKFALCSGFPPVEKAGLTSVGLIEYFPVKKLLRCELQPQGGGIASGSDEKPLPKGNKRRSKTVRKG